jgi:succinyl-diaminopimelate desuccinylase
MSPIRIWRHNPIPAACGAFSLKIDAITLDEGTEFFQPSNIEITDLHTRQSMQPTSFLQRLLARLSIRFQ